MPHQSVVVADKRRVKSWQGTARAKARAVMAAACLAVCVCATPAKADESAWPTAQAKAYHFDFVPYLDPPEKPAAICLVDSGVNVTPDTPADSPDGPILERTALDGGPGTGSDASWEGEHGTRMAFAAGAPMNGWGTVGLWPGLRIVSVRAMPMGANSFPFDDYRRAIGICETKAPQFRIVAINLSLGCACLYSAEEIDRLQDAISGAHTRYDLSVIASAGNDGSDIGMPAAATGVLSVGAGDLQNQLCPYSNRGSALDLVAPGCRLDGAWGTGQPFYDWLGGTSPAASATAGALALLRSYRSDLTWRAAEQLLTSIKGSSVEPVVDVERMMRSAGLSELVDRAQASMATATSPEDTRDPAMTGAQAVAEIPADAASGIGMATDVGSTPPNLIGSPRLLGMVRTGRRLVLRVRKPRTHAQLVLQVQQHVEFGFATRLEIKSFRSTVVVQLPRSWVGSRVALQYVTRGPRVKRSAFLYRQIR